MATKSENPEALPTVCPRFVAGDDDSVEDLSREESAIIGFLRCLPGDLKPEFKKAFKDDGRPFEERMAAFRAKAQTRREEIVAAGWTWWA